MPEAEFPVTIELARALIAAQHPDLADAPLGLMAEGWDNVNFTLGEALVVRLPRRAIAAPLIENEQRWLPLIAPHLPVAVPTPARVGQRGCGYPWRWSIAPRLPGRPLDAAPLRADQGQALGEFLRALHRPAPAEAPRNPYRGVPLEHRRAAYEERHARLRARGLAPPRLGEIWAAALAAPIDAGETWLHGDLHPLNLLSADGVLSGVVDWGDVCAGDAATDLAGLWTALPNAEARRAALSAYGGASDATLARARGWAAYFAVVLIDTGLAGQARYGALGQAVLRNLIEPD